MKAEVHVCMQNFAEGDVGTLNGKRSKQEFQTNNGTTQNGCIVVRLHPTYVQEHFHTY